jgi:hypothetical protein
LTPAGFGGGAWRRISPFALAPPVDNHAGIIAAAMGHRDRPGGRRGSGHGPAHGIVWVGAGAAILIQAGEEIGNVLRSVVWPRPLNEGAIEVTHN